MIDIPAGYPPRQAMGYLAVPVLVWAEKMGLSTVAGQWQTAFELRHRVPLVYGTHGNTAVVAQRWTG